VNALEALIVRRIRAAGPITMADYMAEALGHPVHGYYMRGDPFGRAGDFTTAPEISQMFGELVGLWCVDTWRRMGAPGRAVLVELGPGRGTLMADALRAIAVDPAARAALDPHLVETSPALAAVQRARLAGAGATWHTGIGTVPEGPMVAIANELFDALPVRQVERTPAGWRERMVGVGPDGRLTVALAPAATAAAMLVPASLRDAPSGAVAEMAPAALVLADALARRVAARVGAALIVDFGDETPAGRPTLQAVRGHARAEPLADPGEADLAAAVDFGALARAAREAGAAAWGPVPQGRFLHALGLGLRAERLRRRAAPEQAAAIDVAVRRLAAPEGMGTLFKALAIAHPALGTPAGFAGAAPTESPC